MLRILSLLFLSSLAYSAPVKIIFDTDMATDCDDAAALAMLHTLADKGEAEILAITTNTRCPGNASAAACAAINRYYGRPDIPIGTDKDGAKIRGIRASRYTEALRAEFATKAKTDDQMPDALSVYRRALAAQPDQSVVICSVGVLSNLEDLWRSKPDEISPLSGEELVTQKVKLTVIMGGGFPRTHNPETNIKLDPAAAVTIVNEWRSPILWQGYEVGAAIITGSELKPTPATNPVRKAFELHPHHGEPSLEIGKPSHDQATVLLAVRGPQPDLWNVVDKGRVILDSEGHTEWSRDWAKQHRYVKIKGRPVALQKLIGQLMSTAPAKP